MRAASNSIALRKVTKPFAAPAAPDGKRQTIGGKPSAIRSPLLCHRIGGAKAIRVCSVEQPVSVLPEFFADQLITGEGVRTATVNTGVGHQTTYGWLDKTGISSHETRRNPLDRELELMRVQDIRISGAGKG